MSNKETSIFFGICFGIFCLSLMFFKYTDQKIATQNEIQEQRLEEFKKWSNEICKDGFSIAEILKDGQYKVVCK